jgi:hypothetical protein
VRQDTTIIEALANADLEAAVAALESNHRSGLDALLIQLSEP